MNITSMRNKIVFPASTVYGGARTSSRSINMLQDAFLRQHLGLLVGAEGGTAPLAGIHADGDNVITKTSDGIDTNTLWREFQDSLALLNAQRRPIIDLLTYTVPKPYETVAQAGSTTKFEKMSEFGVPRAVRTGVGFFKMGFSFDDYDVGIRFTWRFLRDADAEQVRSVNAAILEADNRLIFEEVMRTLYRNTNRVTEIDGQEDPINVYTFYNGADGVVPPKYRTNVFDNTHNHYLVSGAATIDSGDLDDITNHLAHHGYNATNGYQLVACVNAEQGDVIRNFRSVPNGGTAKYDFIPANGTPNFLLPEQFIVNTANGGTQPPDKYRGIAVLGKYGDLLILQDDYFPAKYVTAFATGGQESIQNPIGIREHARPEYRGLILLKGRDANYPLQESYYGRGFGTGIRHRGAGVVMQIKATGSYVVPADYA